MVKVYAVAHISHPRHPRAAADFLYGTLCKGSRIREALVVEDVVEINASDTHANAIERHTFHHTCVDILPQINATYLIVNASTTIVDVCTNLCTIDAEVYLLFQVLDIHIDMFQVKGITSKHPAPTKIRTDLEVRLRRQPYRLSVRTTRTEAIVVVGMCGLKHH